jgi:DNA-binding GntR family transcriptional regulator
MTLADQDTTISTRSQEMDDDKVYNKIHDAILEHRLKPGTKLAEERLAAIFGVTRARVRKAFARLAHEQIVDWFPQRGAFIARPTVEQARDVLEARRIIEPALMRRLANAAGDPGIKALRKHVELEFDADRRQDKRAVVRLSGEFHNLAADLSGNTSLARSIRELSAITCLVILLYDAPTSIACRANDHARIIDAIKAHDADAAARLVVEHLNEIEASVNLDGADEDVDLEEIFS